jgi:hypothetical protein
LTNPNLESNPSHAEHTQAHTEQTHTQIGAETVNPSHAEHTQAQIGASPSTPSHTVFYPSYFFLSCYGEQRENGEQRERTEKRGRAEEKKLKREKILGKMKDKVRKKKKKA